MGFSEKICVSVSEPDAGKALAALKGIPFAEVRLDAMKAGASEVRRIFSAKSVLIATCRPGAGRTDDERKSLLFAAIDAGAKYVDVEVDASDAYKSEIAAAAKKKGCTLIISYHNYEKTPSRAELEQIVGWCFDSGAQIAKIACKSNSTQDNARLLGLLDSSRRLVVIGMGAKGKITRIAAPLLGSPFTFASFGKGKETAEGQMGRKTLEKLMGVLEYG